MNLTEEICSHIKRSRLFAGHERIVVALSGGADSIALLYLLHHSGLQLQLAAAHYNHRLRGMESDNEELFCRETARKLRIPFYSAALVDPAAIRSIQADARAVRYAFLENVAVAGEFDGVATAHHFDDQVESVLLNIFSGGGPASLAGIPVKRGIFRRPLLAVPSSKLRSWLLQQQLSWCEDSSNSKQLYRRNWIRHHLLPELNGQFDGVVDSLYRLSTAASDENRYWYAQYGQIADTGKEGVVRFELHRLAGYPGSVIIRFLNIAVAGVGSQMTVAGRYIYDRLHGWLTNPAAGIRVWYRDSSVTIKEEKDVLSVILNKTGLPAPGQLELPVPGRCRCGVFEIDAGYAPQAVSCSMAQQHLSGCRSLYMKSAERLVLRARQSGDRFRIKRGSKKIKEYLREKGVGIEQRSNVVVGTDGSKILFLLVPGRPDLCRVAADSYIDNRSAGWVLSWREAVED